MKYVSFGIIALGYLTFLLGMYSSKLVVTEMMGVLQLAYVGLLLLDYGDPLLSSLLNFKYFYGADSLVFKTTTQNVKLRSLSYSEIIVHDLNIILAGLFIPFLLGLIFFIVSKTVKKSKPKWNTLYRVMIGEYILVAL